jgi:hypothetical protein
MCSWIEGLSISRKHVALSNGGGIVLILRHFFDCATNSIPLLKGSK